MPKKSIIISAVVLVVAAAGLFVLTRHRGGAGASAGQTANIATVAVAPVAPPSAARLALPPVATGTLFSASPYAAHAHLIPMTGSFDAATQQSLTGFQVNRQKVVGGSFTVQIASLQMSAAPQVFTVAPGDKLYFVENSLMDDGGGTERFLADDFGVLVNANGVILQ